MSEHPQPHPLGAHPAEAGAALRAAREQAGLHPAALAATLKVPVERLQALEQGQLDAFPDLTYARALAKSVCRVLHIDPGPILAALPVSDAPRLAPSSGSLEAPMPRTVGLSGWGGAPRRGALVWLALLIAVLAAVLWWVLPPRHEQAVTQGTAGASTALPASALTGSVPAVPGGEGAVPATPAGAAGEPLPQAVPMPAAPPAPGAAETPAPRPATAAPADTALPRQDRAAAALELQAQGATWVQVVGASGRVWLQRTLQGGETLRFDEDLPLAVTVGRADVTLVRVRGQALDLGPYTRNQVARFDVR